jgi:hypothetical protein
MRTKVLLLSCILSGCGGGGAGPKYDAPLAKPLTITAKIASSSVDTGPANVRGALVWVDPQVRLAAQDVPIQVHTAGSKFALTITHLPPPEAITPIIPAGQPKDALKNAGILDGSKTRSATAYLVIYNDVNGNGQMDLDEPNEQDLGSPAKTSPDQVLGIARDFVVYFEGEVPVFDPDHHNDGVNTAEPFVPKELGFHIYHVTGGELLPPAPGCDPNDHTTPNGCEQHSPMTVGWASIDSEIDVKLTGDPSNNWILDPSAIR